MADGRYDYIETGSLISIKKNVANIIIPSEETRLEMYPMDFEEFCWALGDKVTMPLLKQFLIHGFLWKLLIEKLCVGFAFICLLVVCHKL